MMPNYDSTRILEINLMNIVYDCFQGWSIKSQLVDVTISSSGSATFYQAVRKPHVIATSM